MEWWQALVVSIISLSVGSIATLVTTALSEKRQHRLQLEVNEAQAELAREQRAEVFRRELKRQRLQPVFDLVDDCEHQLAHRVQASAIETILATSQYEETLTSALGRTPTDDERRELDRRFVDTMSKGLAGEPWQPGVLTRHIAATYRVGEQELVVELQVIAGLLSMTWVRSDYRVLSEQLRGVRMRLEKLAAAAD